MKTSIAPINVAPASSEILSLGMNTLSNKGIARIAPIKSQARDPGRITSSYVSLGVMVLKVSIGNPRYLQNTSWENMVYL